AFWRVAGTAPAAAADQPAEGLRAGSGRSGEKGRVAADRPNPPEEPGNAPPSATAPRGGAEKPPGAPPRAPAPPAGAGPRPLHTGMGLITRSRALKGSGKFEARQADLQTGGQRAQQKWAGLTKEVRKLQAECDAPATPAARREESARRIRELRRQIEEA